jgi:hypothetical protein
MSTIAPIKPIATKPQEITYPCTFPGCWSELGVDLLFVPALIWINREVGKRRQVTDWFSKATESEMAEFARCRHHSFESVVAKEYNRRMHIRSMSPFGEVLRLAQSMRDKAQREKDERVAAYRAQHLREKEERRQRREAAKVSQSTSAMPRSAQKRYGDERKPVVEAEAAPKKNKKKGKADANAKKKGKGR